MNINPITVAKTNYNYANFINKRNYQQYNKDNSLNGDNFGKYYQTDALLFNARQPKFVRKASVLDKLTVGLNKIENNDLLIMSNSTQNAKDSLKKILGEISATIPKIVFVEIPGISRTIAFEKNDNQKYLWNLGNRFIMVDDELIQPYESMALKEDSYIAFGCFQIDFSKQPKDSAKLELYSDYFIKEFDFTTEYENIVNKYNHGLLKKITTPEEEKLATTVQENATKKSSSGKLDFSDIGGQNHIVEDIKRNIIFPLRYPEAFEGFNTNRGVIFYGPPGTGKSLMAEIICRESGASCFKIAGAELDNKYVGESEKNWRELHQKAIDSQPSIIFVDEIDAIARDRSGKDTYGDKVLNQILALMSDDEKEKRNIVWIGATNKVESLDAAITRSGRFGKKYEFLAPSTKEDIEQIFNIHTNKLKISNDLDKNTIFEKMLKAKTTGADIKILVDDARINAFERMDIYTSMENGTYSPMMLDYLEITNDDLFKALDRFSNNKGSRKPIGYGL